MNHAIRFFVILPSQMLALVLMLLPCGRVRAVETLVTFVGSGPALLEGDYSPDGRLAHAADGNVYGINLNGTGFQLTPAGVFTVLPHLDFAPGAPPTGPVQGPDGNSYGVVAKTDGAGGTNVVRVAPEGTQTTVYSFLPPEAFASRAPFIQGTDGNFYGTTYLDGAQNLGSVVRLAPDGFTRTTLHSFDGDDGRYIESGLIQATDGNFYGTASGGGSSNAGTIYRITPDGIFTVLHEFNTTDGAGPSASLFQATDGNFYGTTARGGGGTAGLGGGTVFRMTPDGALITLHAFTGDDDGASPTGPLIEGDDGNFYGTTSQGTVFQIIPDGTLTTLRAFDRLDGDSVNPVLVRDSDGTIYGTTGGSDSSDGGVFVDGSVFRLRDEPPGPLPTLTAAVAFPKAAATDGEFVPTYGSIVLTLTSPATKAIKVKYTVSGNAVPGTTTKRCRAR